MGDEHSSKGDGADRTNHSLASAPDTQHSMASAATSLSAMEELQKVCNNKYKDQLSEALTPPHAQGFQPSFQQQMVCPALYPPSTNCLLSYKLLLTLGAMNPNTFLEYIFKELSNEEIESLMKDEKQRRKSFLAIWPDENLPDIWSEMAQTGFYYLGTGDEANCVFCHKTSSRWNSRDDPMFRHAQSCPFNSGHECGNIKWEVFATDPTEPRNLTLLRYPDRNSTSFNLGIATTRAEHSEFAIPENRNQTFYNWPIGHPYAWQNFLDTSFFYTNYDDLVRCFYCSCAIRGWSPGHDPWKRHAQHFAVCNYLIEEKGPEYVENANTEWLRFQRGSRQTELEKKAEKQNKSRDFEQKAMEEFCLKLGHEKEAIDEVMLLNDGVPYDTPRDMIEMLYQVEERQLSTSNQVDGGDRATPVNLNNQSQQMVMANEDAGSLLAGEDSDDKMIDINTPAATCHTCYRRTGVPVQAAYIGLPCGHLIYCESCKDEEKNKCDNSAYYRSKCVYRGCNATLSGLFRCYVN